jgi:predicted ester cyclase
MPDEMKAKVRSHFEDFVNNRNAEVIRTNMTADFYDHDGPGGEPTDAAGDEKMMRGMYSVMPDLHLTIEDMIAEGDKVVCKNQLALDRSQIGQEDGVPRLRPLALRGQQDRRALGHRYPARGGLLLGLEGRFGRDFHRKPHATRRGWP